MKTYDAIFHAALETNKSLNPRTRTRLNNLSRQLNAQADQVKAHFMQTHFKGFSKWLKEQMDPSDSIYEMRMRGFQIFQAYHSGAVSVYRRRAGFKHYMFVNTSNK